MDALDEQVGIANVFLDSAFDLLNDSLETSSSRDTVQWVDQISSLQQYSKKPSSVIGILGPTGAGKSSLINALIGVDKLLPTNCMRACTAVATEISYNSSEILYRAEVQFISRQEWQTELGFLRQDVLNEDGAISKNCSKIDTEAHLACSKLRAVYPQMKIEHILSASIDELMNNKTVVKLDKTINIEEHDAKKFREKLRTFIDSKEKKGSRQNQTPDHVERAGSWPLLRTVRLFVKSSALKHGTILVDLPGIHDSNAARAAVAREYIKKCTGFFIATPINRAVDDKSAKILLNDVFHRQLKLDGNMGNVTVICTQSDNISISEVAESLGLAEQIDLLQNKIDLLGQSLEGLEDQYDTLRGSIPELNAETHRLTRKAKAYEDILIRARKGEMVFEPTLPESPLKRRRQALSIRSRKKQSASLGHTQDSSEDSGIDEIEDDIDKSPSVPTTPGSGTLTVESIEMKLAEIEEQRMENMQKTETANLQLDVTMENLKKQQIEREQVECEAYKFCISARNEYGRNEIKQDLIREIKEFEQQLGAEDDPEGFDPGTDGRDYDEISNRIHVFCTSSRAYQRLRSTARRDKVPPGFSGEDDTEIPQLRLHCSSQAEILRTTSISVFLRDVNALADTLRTWTRLPNDVQIDEVLFQQVEDFASGLLELYKLTVSAIKLDIQTKIFDKLPKAAQTAQGEASSIVEKWGQPRNREDRSLGGLSWNTYKAVCGRLGEYAANDFNNDLLSPMLRDLVANWEKVFVSRVPRKFDDLLTELDSRQAVLMDQIDLPSQFQTMHGTTLQFLKQQIGLGVNKARRDLVRVRALVSDEQKECNRDFLPAIRDAMQPTYQQCYCEFGMGMFSRMKTTMEQGVTSAARDMFQMAADNVEGKLRAMTHDMDQQMQADAADVSGHIRGVSAQLHDDRSEFLASELQSVKDSVKPLLRSFHRDSAASKRNASDLTELQTDDVSQSESIDVPPKPKSRSKEIKKEK